MHQKAGKPISRLYRLPAAGLLRISFCTINGKVDIAGKFFNQMVGQCFKATIFCRYTNGSYHCYFVLFMDCRVWPVLTYIVPNAETLAGKGLIISEVKFNSIQRKSIPYNKSLSTFSNGRFYFSGKLFHAAYVAAAFICCVVLLQLKSATQQMLIDRAKPGSKKTRSILYPGCMFLWRHLLRRTPVHAVLWATIKKRLRKRSLSL